MRKTLAAERFWTNVDKRGPDECWPWTGYVEKNGYARVRAGGRTLVHRRAYELSVGPIPEGMVLDHTCHNKDPECPANSQCQHRRCCNPSHAEPSSNRNNVHRGNAGQQWALLTCPAGHSLTGSNVYHPPGKPTQNQCKTCKREATRRWRSRTTKVKANA